MDLTQPRRWIALACALPIVIGAAPPDAGPVAPLDLKVDLSGIPFVGCASDGQVGPRAAPSRPKTLPEVRIAAGAADRLAYYAMGEEPLGVLAPRGWHCAGAYGSNGAFLIVSPDAVEPKDLVSTSPLHLAGPAIQLSVSEGSTSGRFEVAKIAARVFPSKRRFVDAVIGEGILARSEFPTGPYPRDVVRWITETEVEFETPPGSEGLGTQTHLVPSGDPITGMAMMSAAENALFLLAVRLPEASRDLAPGIVASARTTYREP